MPIIDTKISKRDPISEDAITGDSIPEDSITGDSIAVDNRSKAHTAKINSATVDLPKPQSMKMDYPQRHYFYVLECNDQTLYAGYTTALESRIATHNAGKGAKYTKVPARRPVRLYYHAIFATKREAMQEEYAFKQLTRTQKIAYIKAHQYPLDSSKRQSK